MPLTQTGARTPSVSVSNLFHVDRRTTSEFPIHFVWIADGGFARWAVTWRSSRVASSACGVEGVTQPWRSERRPCVKRDAALDVRLRRRSGQCKCNSASTRSVTRRRSAPTGSGSVSIQRRFWGRFSPCDDGVCLGGRARPTTTLRSSLVGLSNRPSERNWTAHRSNAAFRAGMSAPFVVPVDVKMGRGEPEFNR